MKFTRLARLMLTLTPLCLAATPQCAPAQAPSAQMRLPAGAPPPTAAQQQKFTQLNAQFNRDILALKSDQSMSPAQKTAKAQQLGTKLNADMLAILTPAQRAVVLKQRTTVVQLRQQFLKQHAAEIAQANQLGQAYQKSITAAQKQKIATIQKQAQAQLQKLQGEKSSDQVKQQEAGAIVRDAQRQEKAVLTPTQQSEINKYQAIQIQLHNELMTFAKAHNQQ